MIQGLFLNTAFNILLSLFCFPLLMMFWFPKLFEMRVLRRELEDSWEDEEADKKKPLLILDLNKVLAFRNFIYDDKMILHEEDKEAATVLGNHYAWKRPHLDYFLDFVFENFTVAVWSSANSKNVDLMCDFIFGDYLKRELLFVWSQDQCEKIKPHPAGSKPYLLRKDLVRVWNTFREYDETNTVIFDDCPHKMTQNPALNVIFPKPWSYLKPYLEKPSDQDTYLRFEAIVDLEQRVSIL